MSRSLTLSLTLLAMIAFAGNSLLCRLALQQTTIDPASFTAIRIVSGALTLWLIVRLRRSGHSAAGSWPSALALFTYAAAFSYAYVSLPAATGALLLFGAVQATMLGYGLWAGERLRRRQFIGLALAMSGLVGLLLPGLAAPPLSGALLMLGAGVAWGIYSLRGKGTGDATSVTAGNFQRAVPLGVLLALAALPWHSLDVPGFWYAIASGVLASGVGYAIWYTALRGLKATSAATVQLSVPVITAVGGIVFLGETISLRLLITSAAILGGIALVVIDNQPARPASAD
ncbi:MAG: DMT family transporter [Thiobacillaceae bacterium]|jgi:drug/metabolite transporter (DMT)-like permease|nr:DMT family transporter [Thiobacillaceae bacterium]